VAALVIHFIIRRWRRTHRAPRPAAVADEPSRP